MTSINKRGFIPASPDRPVGTVSPDRIPIYDRKGNICGNVGPKATAATVSRFHNQPDAVLGTKDGRRAWVLPELPAPVNDEENAVVDAIVKQTVAQKAKRR
jgi:hypothetical protein